MVTMNCTRWFFDPKKRKSDEHKEKYFLDNGARLLEDLISSNGGNINGIRIFSAEELKRATDNYDERQILEIDSYYICYKGSYQDRDIVVKKPKFYREKIIDLFMNEVVILSGISHKHVVRLLGCCLETESLILVYEFFSDRTLSHHIGETNPSSEMTWEICLRVATEIGDSLAYLHMATSTPTVHRHVKSSNILLNEHFAAKLTDFGVSVKIPLGETHIEASRISGPAGYIAPEYAHSGLITEKVDVYGFGLVLLELLTGKLTDSIQVKFQKVIMLEHLSLPIEEKGIEQVVEASLLKGGKMEQFQAFAELVVRCLKGKAEERPTMKEAVQELRRIKKISALP